MLIAACREEEKASDGYFTRHLVENLPRDTSQVTYGDLIASIPARLQQVPQYEGDQDRILFDTKIIDRDHRAFKLRPRDEGYEYEIGAWGIHGVKEGMKFRVQSDDSDRKFLGVLETRKLGTVSSILGPVKGTCDTPLFQKGAVAVMMPDMINVFIDPDSRNIISLQETMHSSFKLVDARCRANVALKLVSNGDSSTLLVENLDPLYIEHGCRPAEFKWEDVSRSLPSLLHGIANFKYHLDRDHAVDSVEATSGDSHLDFEAVTMALYSLQIHSSGFIQPRSDNLFENLTASLPSDNSASYGIRIKNGTGQPLFFYLIYFDPSTYTIQVCPYRGCRPLKPDPSISQFMNLVLPQCLQSTPSR